MIAAWCLAGAFTFAMWAWFCIGHFWERASVLASGLVYGSDDNAASNRRKIVCLMATRDRRFAFLIAMGVLLAQVATAGIVNGAATLLGGYLMSVALTARVFIRNKWPMSGMPTIAPPVHNTSVILTWLSIPGLLVSILMPGVSLFGLALSVYFLLFEFALASPMATAFAAREQYYVKRARQDMPL